MKANVASYRLRPNKYVDRELFAELVALLVADSQEGAYVYVSMGGNHLIDHLAMYRRAGLRKLYAFDMNPEVVERQRFNAPFREMKCEVHKSEDVPDRLDNIIRDFSAENVIVWLDYTNAKRVGQLQEIEILASRLQVGDVMRVTMNAEFAGLKKWEDQLSCAEKQLPVEERNAVLLKRNLTPYWPSEFSKVEYREIPRALTKCIERAVLRGGQMQRPVKVPIPLLVTKYRDTTQMVTVTVVMGDGAGRVKVPKSWMYAPSKRIGIEEIVIPDLTIRERVALDKMLHRAPAEVEKRMGGWINRNAIQAYKKFHRFYPVFQAVVE